MLDLDEISVQSYNRCQGDKTQKRKGLLDPWVIYVCVTLLTAARALLCALTAQSFAVIVINDPCDPNPELYFK